MEQQKQAAAAVASAWEAAVSQRRKEILHKRPENPEVVGVADNEQPFTTNSFHPQQEDKHDKEQPQTKKDEQRVRPGQFQLSGLKHISEAKPALKNPFTAESSDPKGAPGRSRGKPHVVPFSQRKRDDVRLATTWSRGNLGVGKDEF
ncbi:hypothetical protein Efla_001120 [Eimeria flavescens]